MRSGLFIGCLLLLLPAAVRAGEGKYAVADISPLLRMNADAVIRLEEVRFEIKGMKETVLSSHYVITVLNENGDRWAAFSEYYDKLRSVVSAEGFLYDASGKLMRKVRKKDMEDRKAGAGSSFVDDHRVKFHSFYQRIYPYTVEYTTEISNRSSLFFPMWTPRPGPGIAVEKSIMSVICPADYHFRYKMFLYNGEPVISSGKKDRTTSWTVTNQPAIQREPFSPRWHEMATTVLLGPTDFQVDDFKGNMQTWESFGRFVYSLNAGRDELPDNIRKEVHQLVDGLQDPRQKIRTLYEFLQHNTHYISIQLGIGGWQPFDAKYVASNRYGDCKALTNYMYSLLKEAGIRSYYTLIRAGKHEQYLTSDFPSQQFNHAILCVVPDGKDTVWLECTSQSLPAGYLSDFTTGRYALLVDETGGKLVRTPDYGLADNMRTRSIKASLSDEGNLQVQAVTGYQGLLQDNIHGLINNLSKEKVREYLHEQLDFPTYDVNQFEYREEKTGEPFINEFLDISVSHYATVTGKRLFIVPNVMTRSGLKLVADPSRRYPIEMGMAYTSADSVEITLLPGYEPESFPPDVHIKTAFGTYLCTTKLRDGSIFYHRRMEQYGGRFPAARYAELLKFYEAIYKADRAQLVLLKK